MMVSSIFVRYDVLGCKLFSQSFCPTNEYGKIETRTVQLRRAVFEMCALYAYNPDTQKMEYIFKTVVAIMTSR
jgi:hypothetical protein